MIRSGFKRKVPSLEPKPPAGPKPKRCAIKGCRAAFHPSQPWITFCSPDCGTVLALEKLAKQKAAKAKVERAATKKALDGLKRRADYLKEAQVAFNAFIRLRDRLAGYPCISSGRPLDWSGNAVDAGHYRSTGSAPHLRFNEDNVHAQSKHDNQYLAGNAVDYRIQLVRRIGLARVEALESDDTPRKFTIDELQAIKAHYRKLIKEKS